MVSSSVRDRSFVVEGPRAPVKQIWSGEYVGRPGAEQVRGGCEKRVRWQVVDPVAPPRIVKQPVPERTDMINI